jgi:malonate transporter and related proteins
VAMVIGVMLIELEVAAGPDLLHGPLKTFLRAAFNVARNPLPVSIALGIVVSAIGLPLPTPVEKWLDLLGAAAAPCALFAIGLFLSDKSIKSGLAEAGLATLIKLLLQPLLAALVLPFFVDLGSVAGKVALLMASLPTAANAFVLERNPIRWNRARFHLIGFARTGDACFKGHNPPSCTSWADCALAKQFDISVEQNSASVLLSTAFSVITVSALLVVLRVS